MGQQDHIKVRAIISGKVQGVGFRASAQARGRMLGLAGWARNLPDGRVEVVCEGRRTQVEEFLRWCRRGPRLAAVEEVTVEYTPYTGALRGFEVR